MKTHEIVVHSRDEFERICKALEGSFGVDVANGEAPTTIEINGENAIEQVLQALDGIVKYSPEQEHDDDKDNDQLDKRIARLEKLFDEELHPRDEGGKFTFAGAAGFVSPNVEHKSFGQATADLSSPRQNFIRNAFADVDETMGVKPWWTHDVVGAWSDGAENSAMVNFGHISYDSAKALMAMKGYIANQKQVLVFQARDTGATDFLANFQANGKIEDIHSRLLADGVEYHTLEPSKTGATVYVYGSGQSDVDKVRKAAEHYGSTPKIELGKGEFIGSHQTTGTDAEQREDARREYESVIKSSGLRGAEKQWPLLRDRWRAVADAVKVLSAHFAKYSPDQPRDEYGRWDDGLGADDSDRDGIPGDAQDRSAPTINMWLGGRFLNEQSGNYDVASKTFRNLGFRNTAAPQGVAFALKADGPISTARRVALSEVLTSADFNNAGTQRVDVGHAVPVPHNPYAQFDTDFKHDVIYDAWRRDDQYIVLQPEHNERSARESHVLWFFDHKPSFVKFMKYDPDQERDDHGRWSGEGYHGTLESNVKSILKNGINRGPHASYGIKQHVYIARFPNAAAYFGDRHATGDSAVVFKINVPEKFRDKFHTYISENQMAMGALEGDVKIRPEWIKAWAPVVKGAPDGIGDWKTIRKAVDDGDFYVCVVFPKALKKYSPDQERDDHGRFSFEGQANLVSEGSAYSREVMQGLREVTDKVAEQRNFTPEDVQISSNIREVTTAAGSGNLLGYADQHGGKVTIYPEAIRLGSPNNPESNTIASVTAHEIQHVKFNKFLSSLSGGPLPDAKDLAKTDGVTDYSRGWWANALNMFPGLDEPAKIGNAQIHAIDETLAEMAAVEQRSGKLPGDPLWQDLYQRVNATWDRRRKDG